MGRMSKEKGKLGEREVVDLIKDHGYEARRGQQHRGGPGSPDVIHSIPNLHIEVKRREKFDLYGAMQQAQDDAPDGEVPVVFHRRSKCEWVVVIGAEDFLNMLDYITRNVKS